MKRWIVFLLMVSLCSGLFQTLPTKAAGDKSISLEEQNIILPNSDVELTASIGKEKIYALVNCSGIYKIFISENTGKSWQKVSAQGLPDNEKFVVLRAFPPEIVILSAKTAVYLSRDGGKRFENLGGPPALRERGEEITSLAISTGDLPQILVGIWNPSQGKFAEDGVYSWGFGGKAQWEAQGMRLVWGGGGFSADVTAVEFLGPFFVALATGNPSWPRPEGTYLNIANPSEKSYYFGSRWNQFPGWPIEVSRTPGFSPLETEILNSKMVLSVDDQESRIYVAYSTRGGIKDDVYSIRLTYNYTLEEVRKLEFPLKPPALVSFDSLSYLGTPTAGTLAAGVTITRRSLQSVNLQSVSVYSLTAANERFSPPYWESIGMAANDTWNCRVGICSDGTIFAATSGPASCFSRSERGALIPVSLIDSSSGMGQIFPSLNFSQDRTLFMNYGGNVLKMVLDKDFQLFRVERIFYISGGFDPVKIRIDNPFIFEGGTKRFWLTKNSGLSWMEMKAEVETIDPKLINGKIWYAGKDGMVYQIDEQGFVQKRISSGFTWIQKLEPGPEGKVLVAGGSKEGSIESLSLIDGDRYQLLPVFPTVFSSDIKIANSQKENAVYCLNNNSLYRLVVDGMNWEKMSDFSWGATDIFIAPEGLYISSRPQIYFSSFPLEKDSKWKALEEVPNGWMGGKLVTVDEKSSFFFLWDSSKITVYNPKVPEEKVAVPVVSPTPTPVPVSAPTPTPVTAPVPTQTPVPATPPANPPESVKPVPPAQPQTVQPKPSVKPQTPAQPAGWVKVLKALAVTALTVFGIIFLVVICMAVRAIRK